MRPFITLLTSTELQDTLGNELSEDEMDELRQFRDAVQEEFRQHLDAAAIMEELYGESWKARDMRAWFVKEEGETYTVSSPILINEDSEEDALFGLLQMLAENLIRQNYPDSDLVENTFDKLDAVAALLARESLRRVMDDDRFQEVMEEARSEGDELKMWRAMEKYGEQWDADDETLYDWLETQ